MVVGLDFYKKHLFRIIKIKNKKTKILPDASLLNEIHHSFQ